MSPPLDPKSGTALEAALRALGTDQRPGLALLERLRAALGPDLGRLAYEQWELRRRARGKLPEPERWWLTRQGLEQASPWAVAWARAAHMAGVAGQGAWVFDGTCGLGVDSLALARAGLRVVSADLDRERAGLCARNLAALGAPPGRVVIADALATPMAPEFWFLDPDRRAQGERSLDPARWSPPLGTALERLSRARGAALKLAPAFDPDRWSTTPPGEHAWVWVSHEGELKELTLYLGQLSVGLGGGASPGRREAWCLRGAEWLRYAPESPGTRDLEALTEGQLAAVECLAEPDPALLRAGFLGPLGRELGLAAVGPGIGWLAGPAAAFGPASAGWLEPFRVLDSRPADRKEVRAMLRRHDIGNLSVRSRGTGASPEELERRFRVPGSRSGTLFVARTGAGRRAFLVERIREQAPPEPQAEGPPPRP